MLLAKLKTVFAFVLVFALFTGGLITFAGHYATAQTDAKKDDSPKKTAPPPSKTEATEPKSADPKVEKKTPKTDPPAQADGMAALKDRLKKHEQDIAKIRQLMLNEIDAEIAKLDAAIAKAKDDSKKGDRTAFQKSAQLAGEKMRLKGMRMQVEHGIHLGGTSLKTPSAPIDAQIGLHLATPSSTLRQQLGLAKNAGLVIDKVSDDSSAGKAGLKAHDVLVQIDGKSVPSDVAAFRKLLAAMPPAAIVDVVVVRQGKQETIKGLMLPAAPHEVR